MGEGGARVGVEGGMNESYSYAFSFTGIRIHNWAAGERERQEGRGRAGRNGGTLLPAIKMLQTQKVAGGTTAPTSHCR